MGWNQPLGFSMLHGPERARNRKRCLDYANETFRETYESFLYINPPIVDVPLQQQQQQGGQSKPLPHFARRAGLLAGRQALAADLDAGARLDVAFVRIQQVDGEAA